VIAFIFVPRTAVNILHASVQIVTAEVKMERAISSRSESGLQEVSRHKEINELANLC
jgi:hypothetical protein